MSVIERIQSFHTELTELRRDIHAHPETAFEEVRTSDLVAEWLQSLGMEIHRGLGKTGVVGTLKAGNGNRAIGLRADMDALPILENNTFSHRSRHEGKMHACGHDGHTTMLLGAAKYLSETRNFNGTIYFIFQPAEETEGGADAMIKDGLFEMFPMETVFGMHNLPGIPVGRFGVRPGPIMAAYDQFQIKIKGVGTHAALPHKGVDPITVGSEIVSALQTIVSRSLDPFDKAIVSVTQFHAGDTWNVIPETAVICGTARSFRAEVQDIIESKLMSIVRGVAASHGASVEIDYKRLYPATVNTEEESTLAGDVAASIVGEDHVDRDAMPLMGSEDFSFMLQKKPGCYLFIGNGDGEGSCMIHNPGYDFNDAILPLGATYWARLAEAVLPA
ncbi:MAG TPA: M20 aminoacylase family protein [Alphaproteobacteria bacterium]|nr:M20 aminoacylase family protein [Alphaproteobacteria bacterium]